MTGSFISGLLSGGMRYDEEGRSQGFSLEGRLGEQALMGATVSAITSGVGAKSGLSGIANQALSLSVSTALSTFNE